MNGANGQPRPTQTILEDALHEMHERERNLQPFVDELAEVRKGIKTLEKALGTGGGSGARSTGPSGPGMGDRIESLLRDTVDPLGMEELADLLGTRNGLAGSVSAMVRSGRIIEVEGGYGLPSAIGSEADE